MKSTDLDLEEIMLVLEDSLGGSLKCVPKGNLILVLELGPEGSLNVDLEEIYVNAGG